VELFRFKSETPPPIRRRVTLAEALKAIKWDKSAEEALGKANSERICTFGKYKGQTYGEIYNKDKSYFRYVLATHYELRLEDLEDLYWELVK